MTPYYADEWLTILEGDCRAVLPTLPADSVDCVVSSPPYWGLRDYGTATWSGGDEACPHEPSQEWIDHNFNANSAFGNGAGTQSAAAKGKWYRTDGSCRCGAIRQDSQLGLERTPEEYVANMVAVFAEVRRVLKPSGTCWLNLGDSYANTGFRSDPANNGGFTGAAQRRNDGYRPSPAKDIPPGLKPKDLVGIPWRVAFALQADGWYLRSDVIWSKPNPMPESVTDRPTKAHEYLFLLTKSARYYFDADAVREPNVSPEQAAHNERYAKVYDAHTARVEAGDGQPGNVNSIGIHARGASGGRNIRSVWTIATRPYPGAHFAVFPPELPERCIKAGSSERGVCPECGAPWERVVERTGAENHRDRRPAGEPESMGASGIRSLSGSTYERTTVATAAWRPICAHTAEPVPAVVLDIFAGSGTVGMVANRLSRRAILIDLNPEYLKQQMQRNAQTPLGLGAA